MKNIECIAIIDKNHEVQLKFPQNIKPGEYKIIVSIDDFEANDAKSIYREGETASLFTAASESSLKFWDNPIDHEVWNNA